MARYIDADILENVLNSDLVVHKMHFEKIDFARFVFEQGYLSGLIEAQIKLADMSTADVESVQYGKWEYDATHDVFSCTVCKTETYSASNFCPNCGTKMDLESED